MPQIVCKIILDVAINDGGQIIMAKQGDRGSRLLSVALTDNGASLPIEADAAVLLNVRRGEECAAFEGRVCPDGSALFALPSFALAEEGSVLCDVSVLDAAGGRLTSSHFQIAVEAAVAPDAAPSESEESDLVAELLSEQILHPLLPTAGDGGFVLAPAVNRKYSVDLSDTGLITDKGWVPLSLQLPTPTSTAREHWIVLYCHAPVHESAGAITLDWGDASDLLFADGAVPQITMGDFDIICTYSATAARWQIGVVQYAAVEGTA
ncbi:MAG: hypothetical protein IJA78_03050 [Clostridia bacterium]|nr:hypothetical protein [Clostridia bacterium]